MSFDIEYLSVEFVKLKDGNHTFKYQLDKTFFEYFGNNDILDADLNIELDIQKNQNLMIMDIFTIGNIYDTCDRCLSKIGLAIDADFKIIYHLNSSIDSTNDTEIKDLNTDVVYLKPHEFKTNIAQSIYESSLMSLPMIKNCDELDVKPCDQGMLEKLERINQGETEVDPRWEKLKNILNK